MWYKIGNFFFPVLLKFVENLQIMVATTLPLLVYHLEHRAVVPLPVAGYISLKARYCSVHGHDFRNAASFHVYKAY